VTWYQTVWVAEEVQTLLECVTLSRYVYIVSLVWGNSSKSQNVFTLQKKIVRLMVDARPTASCTNSVSEIRDFTCWRIKDQLDVTCYFTSCVLNLFRALIYPSSGACDWVWVGWSLQHGHCSNPAAPNLQHTTNQEENDQCGNSTAQSQAPDDGYINARNMFST